MENQRNILENITQKENEANQVRLVELNDEYVIELPIQKNSRSYFGTQEKTI